VFLYGIFHVLFKPIKAFKEIAEKPTYRGPILIILAIIIVSAFNVYVNVSKVYVEMPTPQNDDWTESIANSTWRWTSNGVLSVDSDSVRGNHSLQVSCTNATKTIIKLSGIGPLSCSEGNHSRLFFRIKWIHKNEKPPSSKAVIRLLSGNEGSYFSSSVAENISQSSDEWANITVSVGPRSTGWTSTGSPDWNNITGVQFELSWAPSDVDEPKVKIDDLFFGGAEYTPLLETGPVTLLLFAYLTNTLLNLFINWFVLTIILLIILKITGFKSVAWRPLYIASGYVFSTLIVEYTLNTLLIGMLPQLYLPFEAFNPAVGEEAIAQDVISRIYSENWFPTWQFQINAYLFYVFNAWAALLVAVALRFLLETDWRRAISIAAVAYFIAFILSRLILSF